MLDFATTAVGDEQRAVILEADEPRRVALGETP
jgi:hypothetical protein